MKGKRGQILSTAEGEFLLHGYDGTSIDAIVREIGGSKSTVYSHFPDKAVLFAEVLAKVRQELDFSLPRYQDAAPSDAREGLELAALELASILYRERSLHLLRLVIAEAQRFPVVARQFWEEGPQVAIGVMAGLLQDFPSFAPEQARRAAERVYALLTGGRFLRTLMNLETPPSNQELVDLARSAVGQVLGDDR